MVNVKIHFSVTHSETTNDPASWNLASYTTDMCAAIDGPLELAPNLYRERALDCLAVLKAVDSFMSRARDPRLAWVGISIALNLCSTQGQTAAELARQMGISERRLNNSTARFLKLAGFDPSTGKSAPQLIAREDLDDGLLTSGDHRQLFPAAR